MSIELFDGEYRFLSNFWPANVELDGEIYPSVENAYQAAKTNLVGARVSFRTYSPGEAKKFGRKLVIRGDWESVKLIIMERLIRQKFQIERLKSQIIKTKNAELIEGNWWGDTFWGVCHGSGANNLGKILMKVRSELIDPNICQCITKNGDLLNQCNECPR